MEAFLELSRDFLKKGNSVRFQAKGWSMHPFIKDGDFVIVKSLKNLTVKIGDLAFYYTDGDKAKIHRVVGKSKKKGTPTILIKGDACYGSPEEIEIQSVLGKVTSIERNGQYINLCSSVSKLINIAPFVFWPLIKIPTALNKFINLFNSKYFVKESIDSLRTVADKYNSLEEIEFHSQQVKEGLEDWEKELLKKEFVKPNATILNVGCGAGREAIALAKRGFRVTGIDISSNMIIRSRENAKREGLNINFREQSVTDIEFPIHSFDYVLFSRSVYSNIPTKKWRIKMLKKIRGILKPDGLLVFSAYIKDKRLFSRLNILGFFRRIRNYFFRDKFVSEPGDLMVRFVSPISDSRKLCYCHFFFSREEIIEEIRAAEMTVFEVKDNYYWLVKP